MNEQEIRKIIQDEMQKNYTGGNPQVPPHRHDGSDGIRIQQSDIVPSAIYHATITMAQGTITGSYPNQVINWAIYYIPAPTTPSTIKFFGGALNTTANPKLHAMIIGEAALTGGYSYQPGTSNSVIPGSTLESIIQGSASYVMSNSVIATPADAVAIIRSTASYIAFTSDASNNIYSVARVYSYNNNQLTIQVANATNWSLSGLWTVI